MSESSWFIHKEIKQNYSVLYLKEKQTKRKRISYLVHFIEYNIGKHAYLRPAVLS
jgi:hypothetical protein